MKKNTKKTQNFKIIVDNREQLPFDFAAFSNVETIPGTLTAGDYSIPGAEHLAAIERKTIDDLVGCLTNGRDRFERELNRLRPYTLAAVVVEASLDDLARGRYTSQMQPQAALQSVIAMQVRYGIPFMFCGSRAGAEYSTHGFLSKYAREITKQYEGIINETARRL